MICDEKMAKKFFLKKMPRPIFGHFLLIFGLFWPMFGFIAYLLENCSLFCLHWTDSKQLLKKMLLENFGPFFTHFWPFFYILSSNLKDFCLCFSFPADFLFKFGHSDGSKLQNYVFLDPPTLEVGTINSAWSVRSSVRPFTRSQYPLIRFLRFFTAS